jgi:hypothetical protein
MMNGWAGLLILAVLVAGCARLVPPPGYDDQQIARDREECEREAERMGVHVIRKEDEIWTMPDWNVYQRCLEARGYRFERLSPSGRFQLGGREHKGAGQRPVPYV